MSWECMRAADAPHRLLSHMTSGIRDKDAARRFRARTPRARCLTQLDRVVGVFRDTGRVAMIGYARVSTTDQDPESQAARLREHGCTQVFADRDRKGG